MSSKLIGYRLRAIEWDKGCTAPQEEEWLDILAQPQKTTAKHIYIHSNKNSSILAKKQRGRVQGQRTTKTKDEYAMHIAKLPKHKDVHSATQANAHLDSYRSQPSVGGEVDG
jgi:hypothetical protein